MFQLSVTARQLDVADTGDITVGFPADFSLYDENRDHFITLREFKYALRSRLDNLANPDYLDVVFTDANGKKHPGSSLSLYPAHISSLYPAHIPPI